MGVFHNPTSMFVAICIYYYLSGLLIGVPAWLIMRKRSAIGLRAFAIVGLIIGLLPAGAALGWTIIQGKASDYVVAYNLLFFGLGGLVAGSTYWLIARRSPDRLSPEQAKA
jgi:hypothetical protein